MTELINSLQLREAGGRYYLLDRAGGERSYHRPIIINEMGAEIYTQLSKGKNMEETVSYLSGEYGMPQQVIREDIRSFLADLKVRYQEWR